MNRKTDIGVSFNDPSPEGATYRYEQAMIDADIEGLARDPQLEAMMNELRTADVPIEERMERLKAYFRDAEPGSHAAE